MSQGTCSNKFKIKNAGGTTIMGKYIQDATKLLELVGGKENIAAVSHCMTRMRFVLNDPALANIEAIEAIPSVKGSFTQAGQFQVIIGNTVADFYNDFTAVSGIEGVSKDEAKSAAKQKSRLEALAAAGKQKPAKKTAEQKAAKKAASAR